MAGGGAAETAAATEGTGAVADALSALVNLGYRRADAFGAVTAAARTLGSEAHVQALIRAGLKELAQGRRSRQRAPRSVPDGRTWGPRPRADISNTTIGRA